MSIYLAVDLGTTGCRSILFDEGLREIGSAYEEYPLITPDDKSVEQDGEQWWQLTLATAKKAISQDLYLSAVHWKTTGEKPVS